MALPVEKLPSALAKVTMKGQITIPRAIREAFNIQEGCELLFVPAKDGLRVKVLPPPQKIGELAGSLELKPGVTLQDFDALVDTAIQANFKPDFKKEEK